MEGCVYKRNVLLRKKDYESWKQELDVWWVHNVHYSGGVRGRVERSNRVLVSISSFFFQNCGETVKIKWRPHLKIRYYNILAPLNMKTSTFWRFLGVKIAENLVLQHFIFPEYEIQYFLMIFWCQNSWKFGITTF